MYIYAILMNCFVKKKLGIQLNTLESPAPAYVGASGTESAGI
jgi:hypothetical protein